MSPEQAVPRQSIRIGLNDNRRFLKPAPLAQGVSSPLVSPALPTPASIPGETVTEDSNITTSVAHEPTAVPPTENADIVPQASTADALPINGTASPGSRNSVPRALKCLQTHNTPGLRELPANAGGRREQEHNS